MSILFFVGCGKDNDSLLPKCLSEKINDKDSQLHGAITRYSTQKGYVYENYSGSGADVYDGKCNIICFLGGVAGNTICVDGSDTLVFSNPVVVWEE